MVPRSDETQQRQRSDSVSTSTSTRSTRFQPPQCIPPSIALLDWDEILVGQLVGQGEFSSVYEVARIVLNDDDDDNNSNSRDSDDDDNDEQRKLRRELAACPKRLVVKHLHPQYLQTASPKEFRNAIADLVQEALYLSTLDHPNIVKVRGLTRGGTSVFSRPRHCNKASGRTDRYFLIMNRLEETLGQRLRRWKKLQGTTCANNNTDSKALVLLQHKIRYAQQMADALRYLHSKNIIFRDLKPQNVGFQGEHTLQLFDFGLVRELPDGCGCGSDLLATNSSHHNHSSNSPSRRCTCDVDTQAHLTSASGTRRYMAPEIFTARKYNLKADVYSWSMVCYEMLALEKPYARFTPKDHAGLVCCLAGRPKLSVIEWPITPTDDGDVRTQVEELLHQTWAHDPARRPSMDAVHDRVQEIGDRLELFVQHRNETATSIPEPSIVAAVTAITSIPEHPAITTSRTTTVVKQQQESAAANPILPPMRSHSPRTISQAA